MNKKSCLIVLSVFSTLIYGMEDASNIVSKAITPKEKKNKILKHFKKITHAPEGGAIVNQGKIWKNKIFLGLKDKEPMTFLTFKELIDEQNQQDLPFILAMVTTAGGDCNKWTINFYSALHLNNWLQLSSTKNRSNSFFKDPKNNQLIIDCIKYFTIKPSISDKFEYLGSDYDLFMGDKKVNDFMNKYFKAVEFNDGSAQTGLGWRYYEGYGVVKNTNWSLYWNEKAATNEDAIGQYNLGIMYEEGIDVNKDFSQAFYWYKKAAENKDPCAQNNVGFMYDQGLGVERDISQAFYWYKRAAENGFAIAQYNVGLMYAQGLGVKKDSSQAFYWYKKAAEQNYELAQTKIQN